MEPTQEQIKEFWEWCGLTEFQNPILGDESISAKPSVPYIEPPNIDLNNLFKYAVPNTITMSLERTYGAHGDPFYIAKVGTEIRVTNSDPALALFWALWQVKEESNDV